MANTYADNPARGLSRLQKMILLWAQSGYEYYIAEGFTSMVTRVGVPLGLRPTLYGEAASTMFTPGHAHGRHGDKAKKKQSGEAAATSRAIKRLEERELVERVVWRGRTDGIRLTAAGEQAVEYLQKAGQNG